MAGREEGQAHASLTLANGCPGVDRPLLVHELSHTNNQKSESIDGQKER